MRYLALALITLIAASASGCCSLFGNCGDRRLQPTLDRGIVECYLLHEVSSESREAFLAHSEEERDDLADRARFAIWERLPAPALAELGRSSVPMGGGGRVDPERLAEISRRMADSLGLPGLNLDGCKYDSDRFRDLEGPVVTKECETPVPMGSASVQFSNGGPEIRFNTTCVLKIYTVATPHQDLNLPQNPL